MSLPTSLPRYLDNVVNKQTVSSPIPHLHALLTSGDEPPPEIDVFDLIKSSYEVRLHVLPPLLALPCYWLMSAERSYVLASSKLCNIPSLPMCAYFECLVPLPADQPFRETISALT